MEETFPHPARYWLQKQKVQGIVVACAVLHSICTHITMNDDAYEDAESGDSDSDNNNSF
jgi:hypothetical protein